MSIELQPIIKERIEHVAEYIRTDTTNWLLVKRHIIKTLPAPYRNLFSKRHGTTKKHTLSAFDESVMAYWKQLTGVELVLAPEMRHDPNWQWKPSGWALNGGRGCNVKTKPSTNS